MAIRMRKRWIAMAGTLGGGSQLLGRGNCSNTYDLDSRNTVVGFSVLWRWIMVSLQELLSFATRFAGEPAYATLPLRVAKCDCKGGSIGGHCRSLLQATTFACLLFGRRAAKQKTFFFFKLFFKNKFLMEKAFPWDEFEDYYINMIKKLTPD